MSDLATDTRLMAEILSGCEVTEVTDLPEALEIRAELKDVAASVKVILDDLENHIGHALGPGKHTIEGIGTVTRHPRMSRREWDHERLKRDVLDSKLVDAKSGEIIDETPLERVESVWPLKGYNANVGGITKRGLEPDDYATVEFRGYTLEIRK